MKLIGAQLYHQLMTRAVRAARGDAGGSEWTPELQLTPTSGLPPDYIPDAVVRINLYARLARLDSLQEVDAFEEELSDRFGDPPPLAAALVAQTRLSLLAKAAGVRKLSAGPASVAMDFTAGTDLGAVAAKTGGLADVEWRKERLILTTPEGDAREAALLQVLNELH